MRTISLFVQALKGVMEAHMGGRVVGLPPKQKVIEIPGDRLESRYTKVQKVQIVRMKNIPSNLDFATKKSKSQK
jgi:hypothetical protein